MSSRLQGEQSTRGVAASTQRAQLAPFRYRLWRSATKKNSPQGHKK
nr:MAG TPA: hypothetical protein [Caudoviricetes sp.]